MRIRSPEPAAAARRAGPPGGSFHGPCEPPAGARDEGFTRPAPGAEAALVTVRTSLK